MGYPPTHLCWTAHNHPVRVWCQRGFWLVGFDRIETGTWARSFFQSPFSQRGCQAFGDLGLVGFLTYGTCMAWHEAQEKRGTETRTKISQPTIFFLLPGVRFGLQSLFDKTPLSRSGGPIYGDLSDLSDQVMTRPKATQRVNPCVWETHPLGPTGRLGHTGWGGG